MMDKKSDTLWKKYSIKRDIDLKNELINHYVYLVKLVAGRLSIYLNHYVELEDLIGYGTIGLIDAIDKFDYSKNIKFETYASLRIRGAILDEIRRLDWVPRTLRKKQKEFNKVYNTLENQLGRTPSEEEMANYLGVDKEEYYQILQESNVSSLVFIEDYKLQVDAMPDDETEVPDQYLEKQELIDTLAESIDILPEREKMVITLYYFEELTLKEISAILGVSESRISQLHTKGVSRLRQKLMKYNGALPL